MTDFIVDASVVLKWFLAEPDSEDARILLERELDLAAPEIVLAECANTLSVAVRRRRYSRADAGVALATLASGAIALYPTADLVRDAFGIAVRQEVTVYDAVYIGLAVRLSAPLLSDDERQCAAARRHGVTVRRVAGPAAR